MTRKQVLDALAAGHVYGDELKAHRDGTFTFRHSYFYRHGQTAEKYAEAIKSAIPTAEIVETADDFATWPSTSYFRVEFRVW